MKLPANPTPEQATQIGKLLVKRILEEFYTEGIHDLTAEYGDNPLVTGTFVAKRKNAKGDRPEFQYEIRPTRGGFEAEYSAISGVDDADDEGEDFAEASEVLERILTRTESADFSEPYQEELERVREMGIDGIDAYQYAEHLVDLQQGFEKALGNLLVEFDEPEEDDDEDEESEDDEDEDDEL